MPENDNPELEQVQTEDEGGSSDQKPELTPEQLRGIKQRQLTKLAKELGVDLPKPQTETQVENKKTEKKGFDSGDVALLTVKGVDQEDYDFVQEVMQSTGKSLTEVLGTKWFQNELKERQDVRKTENAIPSGSKRSASSGKDSVEYWVAKGSGLPDDAELARKVVAARRKLDGDGQMFTSRPVG